VGVALRNCGLGEENGRPLPSVVVLDWSRAGQYSAEGLGYGVVSASRLRRAGLRVIACVPARSVVSAALADTSLMLTEMGVEVLPADIASTMSSRVLVRVTPFAPGTAPAQSQLIRRVELALGELRATDEVAHVAEAFLTEAIQNVNRHSEATIAAVCVLFHYRRRPPLLEVGVCDDGIGVANALLRQKVHASLGAFSDATVVAAVLNRTLSSRDSSASGLEGGGGLSILMRSALEELSAHISVRSGSALVELTGTDPGGWKLHRLNQGFGTQIRFRVPIQTSRIA
jgi:hypothetical protein